MDKVFDKFAFHFVIGQLAPASLLILILKFLSALGRGDGPGAALAGVLKTLSDPAAATSIVLWAVPLGLLLWAFGATTAANRESFRKNYLDANGAWVDKPDDQIRHRTPLRKALAHVWIHWSIAWLLFVAPLILAFDVTSILGAKPRNLYKFIPILRSPKIDNEVYLSVIDEFAYSSVYFTNMAIALLVAVVMAVVVAAERRDAASTWALVAIYAVCSLHYLMGRLLKIAFDDAVDPAGLGAQPLPDASDKPTAIKRAARS
jgi:hypothetical protein